MSQSPETRARQHLLLQGFELYTAEAACCMLLQGSGTLLDPKHAWAVVLDERSWRHTDALLGATVASRELAQHFAAAAETCRQSEARGVLCCTLGTTLLLPLVPADVRDARMRVETAITLGRQPPAERLEAFGDEVIEREAKRRGLFPKREPAPVGEPAVGGGR